MNRQPKKKMNKWLKLALVIVIIYGVVVAAQLQLEVMSKRRELEELKTSTAEQVKENEQMKNLLGMENEEAYIEKIAREKYGYAYPEERIYVDISGN